MVGVSLLAFVVGCVDTAVQPIPTSVDYKSEVSVVNLTMGTGTATVNVYNGVADPDSLARNILFTAIDYSSPAFTGQANLGEAVPATNYQEVPSGQKALVVSYTNATTDTFRLTFDSQRKMRIYILDDVGAGTRTYLKQTERYTWQSPGSTDGAALFPSGISNIAFMNGSPSNVDITAFKITGGTLDTTITLDDPDTYTGKTPYYHFAADTYTISVWSGTDSLGSVSQSFGAQKRYTTMLYGDTTSTGLSGLQVKVLTDD